MGVLTTTIAAGEMVSEPLDVSTYQIVNLQPRGLAPAVATITLPENWTACRLDWGAVDWRGSIVVDAYPGQTLVGPPFRRDLLVLRCDRPQAQDVTIRVGMTAVESDEPRLARPDVAQMVAPTYMDRLRGVR